MRNELLAKLTRPVCKSVTSFVENPKELLNYNETDKEKK